MKSFPGREPAGALLGALKEIASAVVASKDDLTPVLELICAKTVDVLGASGAYVAVPLPSYCPSGEGTDGTDGLSFMEIVATAGEIPPPAQKLRIPIAGTETGTAFCTGEPRLIEDFFADSSAVSAVLAQVFDVRSGVFVPLSPVGTLAILGKERAAFDEEDRTGATVLAGIASLVLRLRQTAGEAERSELLSALHDGAMQLLYAALLKCELGKGSSTLKEAVETLSTVEELVRSALAEIRKEASVAGTTQLSLKERLLSIASLLGEGTEISVEMEGGDLPGTHPYTSQLARIAMEATSNAIRHGKASKVEICFRLLPRGFRMEIRDDGSGFDPGSVVPGMGMASMPRRASRVGADFSLSSVPGEGTTVVVERRD